MRGSFLARAGHMLGRPIVSEGFGSPGGPTYFVPAWILQVVPMEPSGSVMIGSAELQAGLAAARLATCVDAGALRSRVTSPGIASVVDSAILCTGVVSPAAEVGLCAPTMKVVPADGFGTVGVMFQAPCLRTGAVNGARLAVDIE